MYFRSSTLRQKSDEATVSLLGRKGLPVGKERRRESLESCSDDSFSQTQSETEQSDVECRVHALKVCLKAILWPAFHSGDCLWHQLFKTLFYFTFTWAI